MTFHQQTPRVKIDPAARTTNEWFPQFSLYQIWSRKDSIFLARHSPLAVPPVQEPYPKNKTWTIKQSFRCPI
jgi:hypothetical protein